MKYNEIKTPKELLAYMSENIRYGFVDETGKEYGSWNNQAFQDACRTKWRLSSPERLIKVKHGHCYDQVELERDWFTNHGYKFRTFYILFELSYDNSYSTHTYLVFENNQKYYYFEHSDFNNRGIYEFETYDDAINYQIGKHIEENKQRNPVDEKILSHLHVYEYDQPIYGCTSSEFIDYILENAREVEIKNYKIK